MASSDFSYPKKVRFLKWNGNSWVTLLIVYFSVLIVGSLIASVLIWKPTTQSSGTNITKSIPISLTNKSVLTSLTTAPNTTKTITTNSTGTLTRNVTLYRLSNNQEEEFINAIFTPSSLIRETRLIELALIFGVVGSSIHAVTSLTIWQSRNKLDRSFFTWYLTRPMVGAALAVTVYLLLRASLLTTVSIGSQSSATGFINDYGVAGISAVVGLMTAQMTQKLRDVFDAMFGIQKGTDKGEIEIHEKNITIVPKEMQISINQSSVLVAIIMDNANKPIPNLEVHFGIVDSTVVKSLDTPPTKTDANGIAVLRIQGSKVGDTKVHAAIELDKKTVYDSSSVKVVGDLVSSVEGKGELSVKSDLSNV
jgi:hypothetical protein